MYKFKKNLLYKLKKFLDNP